MTLGYRKLGSGEHAVIVMNDWTGDTTTWQPAEPYLNLERFSWHFVDLRGYGRSKTQRGQFTLLEAAADVLELASVLQLSTWTIIGHSMSTLVALHLAQHEPQRVQKTVVIGPPPPQGFELSEGTLTSFANLVRGGEVPRSMWMRTIVDGELPEAWLTFKARRWCETSDVDAVATYAALFGRDGLPDRSTRIVNPVLAVTGELEGDIMRGEAVRRNLTPLCEHLTVRALSESGHYPMQEMPPRLVGIIERFLSDDE